MEITLSMVLLGILFLVGTNMVTDGFTTTRLISNERLTYSAARYALERMSREIHEIDYDANNKITAISSFGNNAIKFNKVGLTGTTTTVEFQISGTELQMRYGGSGNWNTLMTNVSVLKFDYYDDSSSTPLTLSADKNSIRYVNISMTITPPQTQALTLETRVNLRNT